MAGSKIIAGFMAMGIVIAVVAVLTVWGSDATVDGPKFIAKHQGIQIKTADGLALDAVLTLPARVDSSDLSPLDPLPAVLLVPAYLESGKSYTALPEFLSQRGMAALTINPRLTGQGGFNPEDLLNLPKDVSAGLTWLDSHAGIAKTGRIIVATGLSARAAILAGTEAGGIDGYVFAGAVLDETARKALAAQAQTPLLVLVSIQDGPAGDQATAIRDLSQHSATQSHSWFGAGEGSDIFRSPKALDVITLISDWCNERFGS